MQHAIERVERPGESQEALDGKKATAPVAVVLNLRADALTAAYSGNNQRGRSEMEQAALNRMVQSIAQLTLCQVTGEEIATARESVPETPGHPCSSAPADHWPWQCNTATTST